MFFMNYRRNIVTTVTVVFCVESLRKKRLKRQSHEQFSPLSEN